MTNHKRGRPSVPLTERFWSKVEVRGTDECWPWKAALHTFGYGLIGVGAHGTKSACRVSYEIHNGPIPDGLLVRHKCDNPGCVNPRHLELGTAKDNSRDMSRRRRARPGNARLSLVQVDQIRMSGASSREVAAEYRISMHYAWALRTGRARPTVGHRR